MAEDKPSEGTWSRAWRDTRRSIESFRFVAANVVIDASAAIGSALVSSLAINSLLVIAFIGALSAAAGGTAVTLTILSFHAIRAPFRQRDEARKALEDATTLLDLDVELGVFGFAELNDDEGEKRERIYQIGDLLIVNRGLKKVILRLRVRVSLPPSRLPWASPEEFAYASTRCVQERSGMKFASVAGSVPHLPTEMPLEHGAESRLALHRTQLRQELGPWRGVLELRVRGPALAPSKGTRRFD